MGDVIERLVRGLDGCKDLYSSVSLYFLYNIAFGMGHLDELCLEFPILLYDWIDVDVFTLHEINAWDGFYKALRR